MYNNQLITPHSLAITKKGHSGHHKVKKERTITEGDSGRDQEGQAHGGTILSMAQ